MSAKPVYQVIPIDLAVARNGDTVVGVGVGVKYDAVTIHQLPVGANVSLAFGTNSSACAIPLLRTETFRILDSCEHPFFCDEGLFITNAIGAGILILIVSMGTNPSVSDA